MTDFLIDFQPLGRRAHAGSRQTILAAAQEAGVGVKAICGGEGTCKTCRVRIAGGQASPPSPVEQAALGTERLAQGWRLACQAYPQSELTVDIPPESLTAPQRLQIEGRDSGVTSHPAVSWQDLEFDSSVSRVVRSASGQTISVLPGMAPVYGLAADIGTTKVAAYVLNLETGETIARAGLMNPQVAYGEDVISRIAYAERDPAGRETLQTVLVDGLNRLVKEMCASPAIPLSSIVDAVLVGNTAMTHLLAGWPVSQLGQAPYVPAVHQAASLPARELRLEIASEASIYLPPAVAGFVGADHLAMLIATGAWKRDGVNIALDIGTNTEISLVIDGRITCCSCASGPAFEGAHIREGMRAAPGAIEHARWQDGKIRWQTIDHLPPVGICGSGILDVVAAMLVGRVLHPSGRMGRPGPDGEYRVVPAAESGTGSPLMVTRKDIHEIQLAKAAIRAGIACLLEQASLTEQAIDQFIVAGAFGTYLDLESAIQVGMFPALAIEKFVQVGNAAGVGAKQMLASIHKRREAERLARELKYLELTTYDRFTPLFIENLSFKE